MKGRFEGLDDNFNVPSMDYGIVTSNLHNSQQARIKGIEMVGCFYKKLDVQSLVNVKDALGITVAYENDALKSQFQDMANEEEIECFLYC